MMQLFVSDKGFVKVYGIKYEKEFINNLKLFWKEVGEPKAFIVDFIGQRRVIKFDNFWIKLELISMSWKDTLSMLIELNYILD